jgi:hypothetical protein
VLFQRFDGRRMLRPASRSHFISANHLPTKAVFSSCILRRCLLKETGQTATPPLCQYEVGHLLCRITVERWAIHVNLEGTHEVASGCDNENTQRSARETFRDIRSTCSLESSMHNDARGRSTAVQTRSQTWIFGYSELQPTGYRELPCRWTICVSRYLAAPLTAAQLVNRRRAPCADITYFAQGSRNS